LIRQSHARLSATARADNAAWLEREAATSDRGPRPEQAVELDQLIEPVLGADRADLLRFHAGSPQGLPRDCRPSRVRRPGQPRQPSHRQPYGITDSGRRPTGHRADVGSMCARQFRYRMTPGGTTWHGRTATADTGQQKNGTEWCRKTSTDIA
jgi:hypothetical protein